MSATQSERLEQLSNSPRTIQTLVAEARKASGMDLVKAEALIASVAAEDGSKEALMASFALDYIRVLQEFVKCAKPSIHIFADIHEEARLLRLGA